MKPNKITEELKADLTTKLGMKFDSGSDKLRWDLLPFECIEHIVLIYTLGAKKYADNNWKYVDKAEERYFSAMMRHIAKYKAGERYDKELQTSHIGMAAWNALTLLWFEMQKDIPDLLRCMEQELQERKNAIELEAEKMKNENKG